MGKYLSEITQADILEITKLAALFFTPKEVATMLQLNISEFVLCCDIENHAVYDAFHGGRLQAEVDVRTSILKLAKSGSSPAQTLSIDLLNKSRLKMMDR